MFPIYLCKFSKKETLAEEIISCTDSAKFDFSTMSNVVYIAK